MPTMCQAFGSANPTTPLDTTVPPAIVHTATSPTLSWNRTSEVPSPLKSPTPRTCHDGSAKPMMLLDVTVPAFIVQIATSPTVSRHRMSALPLRSKSPPPTMFQFDPAVPMTGLPTRLPLTSAQIETSPVPCWRHRMSSVPPPSKLPVVATDQPQLLSMVPTTLCDWIVSPFICQIEIWPVLSRHRMSDMPSPLKSPVPSIVQLVGGVATMPLPVTLTPFISQIETSPKRSRHSTSEVPLLSKSRGAGAWNMPMFSEETPTRVIVVPSGNVNCVLATPPTVVACCDAMIVAFSASVSPW